MEKYIILSYNRFWDGFIIHDPSYAYGYYERKYDSEEIFKLSADFDEMHDSEYPLCIISGCSGHGRKDGNSSELYTLRDEDRPCKCNKSQWYTVRQNILCVVNLKRYVIYVYNCGSSK